MTIGIRLIRNSLGKKKKEEKKVLFVACCMGTEEFCVHTALINLVVILLYCIYD